MARLASIRARRGSERCRFTSTRRAYALVTEPAHPRPHPVDADQRVLGQLLGLHPIAGQQEAQAPQPPVLSGEELAELQVLSHNR
jgi:hypothetical protein